MPPKKNKRVQDDTNAADDDVPDRLICPVCMEVPEKVMLTDECGHLLCEPCVNKLMGRKKSVKCPVCTKQFTKDTVRHSVFLQREINALPIECPSEGCDWKKVRSGLAAHLKKCPEAEIPCINADDGCKATVKRKELNEHLEECREATVNCPNKKAGCKEQVKRKEMDRHCRHCEYEMVSCPNKGCDAKMLRKDADDHQDECPEAMVRCAHAEDGCKVRMKRKLLEEHMEANKFEHLQLQVKSMKDDFTKQIHDMKEAHGKETKALKKQCESLEEECESLEEENETLKEASKGERCVVKLPVNEDGSKSHSKEFTLFGEQWKLSTGKHKGYRTMFLYIVSAAKYDCDRSLTLLSTGAEDVCHAGKRHGRVSSTWGRSMFIEEERHSTYIQNGCFHVEVWIKETPTIE